MRKLTKTIALVSLLSPASGYPLGVGELKIHSALNQNLNAEIDLVLSNNESASDITVKLAPPDKFDKAGLSWSYFLSKIKFRVESRPNGAVIRLSSTEALREPYLDFLVEVVSPTGNIYREFTVLVDPPSAYHPPVYSAPSKETYARREEERYEPVPRPYKSPRATSVATPRNRDVYGPVGRSDTLWKVAARVKPSREVSVEQTMIALYETNPNAFFKENVNALKAGAKLKVPSKETILKLSHKQALEEFDRQNQVWSGKLTEKPKTEKAPEPALDTQLKLVAPSEAVVPETQNQSNVETNPSVQAPAKSGQTSATGPATATTDPNLQARLEKLEQQLAVMQQMLAVKDQQLAALQQGKPQETAPETKSTAPETAVVPPPAVTTAEVKPEQTEAKPVVPAPKAEAVKPKPAVKKPAPKPVQVAEPESFFSGIYSWGLGLLGIGLLSGAGFIWWRKKHEDAELDTDSMFAASSQISLPSSEDELLSVPLEDNIAYDVGTVGESSFLSEFTPSDFSTFDSDQHEIDPISEADVYLAYGRYQQAEELIKHAISENPDNNDYKLKLLEIYYANENKEAFEKYTKDLKLAGKHQDSAFWSKVIEMGSEIIPGAAILAADFTTNDFDADLGNEIPDIEEEAQDELETKEPQIEDKISRIYDDLDFELPPFGKEGFDETIAEPNDDLNHGVDFDLSSFDLKESVSPSKLDQREDNDHQINFDLSSFDQESQFNEEAIPHDDIESIDFNSDFDTELKAVAKIATAPEETDNNSVDFDSFDFSIDPKPVSAGSAKAAKSEENEMDFDFNFDFDVEKTPNKAAPEMLANFDFDLGVSDLTDMDELETKIDLARAYIDMGDQGAAREIANEVVEKGSMEQKKAAQTILDELK